MGEDKIQAAIFQYHWNNYPEERGLLFHVPNGGKRNKAEASKLMAVGVVAGIPDLVYSFAGKVFFMELKTLKGVISPVQKKRHATLRENGSHVFIIRTPEQGIRLIEIIRKVWGKKKESKLLIDILL